MINKQIAFDESEMRCFMCSLSDMFYSVEKFQINYPFPTTHLQYF